MLSSLKVVDVNKTNPAEVVKKRLSVERIYQKKTQLEHILIRPDSYIGSVESTTQPMFVWDDASQSIVQKNITFVPGLYKIFDEILVNAADNKQRDPSMDTIKITVDPGRNLVSIWNNGRGIPITIHKEYQVYVPTLIFGQLLTSSNYDDQEQKVTGGRNGYGAKLCNIFSKRFTVETCSNEYRKTFKQTWLDNMSKAADAQVTDFNGKDYTMISFEPDLARFKMASLDEGIVSLMKRRAYDVAGSTRGISVYLNGEKIKIKSFREYVELYLKSSENQAESNTDSNADAPSVKLSKASASIVHEIASPRWEVCVVPSEGGFQQVSFVNSIATTKGGTHVNYITDCLVEKLSAAVKKKNKEGANIKPFQVKNHMWVFVNCLIVNPTFDSQTKENMTSKQKDFGSTCELSVKFYKQLISSGILESILSWVKFKAQSELKKCSGSKQSRIRGLPKLDDANDAGTKHAIDCALILTEGDSAKSMAVGGLGVIGRDRYGVFPLRGKLLNVRDATSKQVSENEEIRNLVKILGLQYQKKYLTRADLTSLRYGRVMIMTDQDQDGSHIKGLIINFIHNNWPELLKLDFLEEFITPIVKVSKGNQEISFFSIPELEEWKNNTANHHTWKLKYYKGLGTSTSKEAKEYFTNMSRHRIKFNYSGRACDESIQMAFGKSFVQQRKEWISGGMEERRMRREMGLPETYLYQKDTRTITYHDFVNKELILFSNLDNERSIPCLLDGLKPGQRKVMYTCFRRNDKREVKVAQLAGSVAEMSAYHHGEVSLMNTIINLAQNFVGSNNINLLQPLGQFGTRLHGGKDAASPRYIFTMLSPLARTLFPPVDDLLLTLLQDDNQTIEPEWYCPIIPMVLVNGAEGIGTGYSTKIPNYNPRDVVDNIRRLIAGEEPFEMVPWFKGFNGEVTRIGPQKYMVSGAVNVTEDNLVEITELPLREWTQSYKENVIEPMLTGSDKAPPSIIDYKEYHTDTTVHFIIAMSEEMMRKAEQEGLAKHFKLTTTFSTSSMVLFDAQGSLKKFENAESIMREFFDVRLKKYYERKQYLEGALTAEASKLENQARFIMEKIDGKIIIENKPKKEVIKQLVDRGYASDPMKLWKASQKQQGTDTAAENDNDVPEQGGPDFQYLITMPILSLSREKKEELLNARDKKFEELNSLRKKTPEMLWIDDLDKFCAELSKLEEDELLQNKSTKSRQAGMKNAITALKARKPAAKAATKTSVFKEPVPKADTKPTGASMEASQDSSDFFDFEPKGSGPDDAKKTMSLIQHLSPKKCTGAGRRKGLEKVGPAKTKAVRTKVTKDKPTTPERGIKSFFTQSDASTDDQTAAPKANQARRNAPTKKRLVAALESSSSSGEESDQPATKAPAPARRTARAAASKQTKYAFDSNEEDSNDDDDNDDSCFVVSDDSDD